MMEKFEDALSGVERKITVRLGRIEQRLDSLEQNVMVSFNVFFVYAFKDGVLGNGTTGLTNFVAED